MERTLVDDGVDVIIMTVDILRKILEKHVPVIVEELETQIQLSTVQCATSSFIE